MKLTKYLVTARKGEDLFYIDAIEIINAFFSLCLTFFYAIDTYEGN